MLHHVQKWCGNVKSVKTQVANKSRRNIEVLQTTKQQSIEMPFSRCWCLIIRTRYIKSWNFFCKCTNFKLKLMYRFDHFLHPVAHTTRIIICLYIFNQGHRGIPSPSFEKWLHPWGTLQPPASVVPPVEVMIGLDRRCDVRSWGWESATRDPETNSNFLHLKNGWERNTASFRTVWVYFGLFLVMVQTVVSFREGNLPKKVVLIRSNVQVPCIWCVYGGHIWDDGREEFLPSSWSQEIAGSSQHWFWKTPTSCPYISHQKTPLKF